MEGQQSVEVGRQAGADAGETGECRATRQKQKQRQQQRHCLEKEVEYLNNDDYEEAYPEEMTAGTGVTNHRASSVSPQDGSMARKSNKPLMEKKRRQRINRCLNDLKSLVLEGKNKDPSQYSKLEKADILEMTVRHVQALHRLGMGGRLGGGGRLLGDEEGKYRAGFTHCVTEVDKYLRYLSGLGDLPQDIHKKLFAHLNSIATSVTSNVNTNTTNVQNSVNVMTNPVPFILVLNTAPAHPPTTITVPEAAGNSLGAQPAVTLVTTSKMEHIDAVVPPSGSLHVIPQHGNGSDVTLVLPPTHQMAPHNIPARTPPSAALQASAPVLTAILTSDRGRCVPPTVVQPPALSTGSEDSALGHEILDTSDSDMSSSGLSTPLSSISNAGSPAPADDAGRSSPRRPAVSRSPPLKTHSWSSGIFREELAAPPCHSRPALRRHPVLAPKPTQVGWPQCPAPQPHVPKKRKEKSPPPPPVEPQSMWRPWH